MSEYVLELKGITKIFPEESTEQCTVPAVKPGEVHALMVRMVPVNPLLSRLLPGVHKSRRR